MAWFARGRRGVAFALQGGGLHGAFTWGAVDRLIEAGTLPEAVCGVSSGALLATALVQGIARGGAAGGQAAMRALWEAIALAHEQSAFGLGPLGRWLWGWDLADALVWQSVAAAMRLWGSAPINSVGQNPLRPIVAGFLDPQALLLPSAPRLIVAATEIETGAAVLFGNEAVTVETLLASCCLPFVFPSVEIDGRAFWDGAYAGNPPLAPLLTPTPPEQLVLVRAQPARRAGKPATAAQIFDRLNEIACHNVLESELKHLPSGVRLIDIAADTAFVSLPIATKLTAEAEVIADLFAAGRAAAAKALAEPVAG